MNTFYEIAKMIKDDPRTEVHYNDEFKENRYGLFIDGIARNVCFEEGMNKSIGLYPHLHVQWWRKDKTFYSGEWYLDQKPEIRFGDDFGHYEELDLSEEEIKTLFSAVIKS